MGPLSFEKSMKLFALTLDDNLRAENDESSVIGSTVGQ